jgi:ketosteroid isomerase-like protein
MCTDAYREALTRDLSSTASSAPSHHEAGESVQIGAPYNNRFVSIITVKDHKVTHCREPLDPIGVFNASG